MMFSVLVPVYNAENYIERCLDSILNQTYLNMYEVILVDDGSQDTSGEIIDKYRNDTGRVLVRTYHQDNMGEYATRRELVKLSQGKYLLFVDADDILMPEALDILSNRILACSIEPDLVLYDLYKESDAGDERYTLPLQDGEFFSGAKLYSIRKLFLTTKYINSMCTKAIKKKCFELSDHDEEFKQLTNGQDVYQSFSIIDKANNVLYVKQSLYTYKKNGTGTTGTLKYYDRFHSLQILARKTDYYVNRWNISEADRKTINALRLSVICDCVISCIQSKDSHGDKQDFLRNVQNNKYFNDLYHMRKELKLNEFARFVTIQTYYNRFYLIVLVLYIRKLFK